MKTNSTTLKEKIDEMLKSRNRDQESFSDLIQRISGRRSLTELAEITSEEDAEEIAEKVEETRKEIEEDLR